MMVPQKSSPAVQRASDFIKANLEKGVWRLGENLPSTRRLAESAQVSFVTMIRAVAALKAKGLINGPPRGRIKAGDGSIIKTPDAKQISETTPAVQKAFDFIKGNLENGSWRQGEKLPSTRSLAARAQVSFVTMIKAIAALKSQGLISGIPRGHITAGDGSSASTSAVHPDSAVWLMKRVAMEQDILSGLYAHQGKLPSFKELQARYGVCFRTLRKILRSMVADSVVKLQGKAYTLQTVQSRPAFQRIVFITYNVQVPHQSALNLGEYRILDYLEHECIRRGIKLEIVEIDFYNSIETRRMISSAAVNNPALGYVLDLWWYPGEEFQRSHIDLLAKLGVLKRPVAILDEVGEFILPAQFTANPMFQVFRIEGKRAGARVARMLLGMGHQSVAYISSAHIWPWSKQRLEGAIEEYAKAGYAAGVLPVVGNELEINQEQILSLSDFDDSLVKRILAVNGTESQAKESFRIFLRYKQNFAPKQFTKAEILEIKKNLTIVRELAGQDPSTELFNRMCRDIFTQEIGAFVSKKSRIKLFEQALAAHGVTAWICATDGIALTALSFLKNRGLAIPRDLSIAGFDNTPVRALEERLTSFDFNANGFIHRMLNFIARPPKPRGPYRHSTIEVEGIVMQRDTTAPPR